jgi:hypothetical protein
MPGIEPGAFHMQSERSTTELHPLRFKRLIKFYLAFLTVAAKNIDLFTTCET